MYTDKSKYNIAIINIKLIKNNNIVSFCTYKYILQYDDYYYMIYYKYIYININISHEFTLLCLLLFTYYY